jgi:uncharacterized RDD family membrane protein YckC
MAERLAATALPRKGRRAAAGTRVEGSEEGVLGARIFAYIIDSIVLAILSVAFVAAGALYMLAQSDWGERDAPDSAQWGFVYASLATVPAWALLNLALMARRGQSIGQYVAGLQVAREDGRDAGLVHLIPYLLALHPLVFHPLLAAFWALLAFVALSLTSSNVLVLGSLAIALLCVAAPLLALVTAASDGGRRALHDRVASTKVVRLE